MNAEWVRWAVGLGLPFLVGFCAYVVITLHNQKSEINALKLYVAENYAKNETIKAIDVKLDHLTELVNRLVGKLSAIP